MKRVTPHVILAAGWLVFLLYAYPGYMSTSSIDQLVDSRVGAFTDWSSPVLTEVWRVVGIFVSGPAGMLLLDSALLLFGGYVLLRRVLSARGAAIAASCVLLFPPVGTTMAVIWPESALAAFLVAGTAAMLSPRRAIRIVGLALLMLACAMRDGATIAALPIVVLGFVWRAEITRWRRYAIAAGAWLAIALAACGLGAILVDSPTQRHEVARAAIDIAGVLKFGPTITDSSVRRALAGVTIDEPTGLQARARVEYWYPLEIMGGDHRLFDAPSTDDARAALLRGRNTLARAYPRAYLAHRVYQFMRVIGLVRTPQWDPAGNVYTAFEESDAQSEAIQHTASHSAVQRALVDGATWLGATPVFRPFLYLLLGILGVVFAALRRDRDAVMLLASGVVYELSLFFSTADFQYRDSHWLVTAVALGTIFVLARARTPRPATAP